MTFFDKVVTVFSFLKGSRGSQSYGQVSLLFFLKYVELLCRDLPFKRTLVVCWFEIGLCVCVCAECLPFVYLVLVLFLFSVARYSRGFGHPKLPCIKKYTE